MNVRLTSLTHLKNAGAAAIAAATITGLAVVPAHASAASIATTANNEIGNGPCAHDGYESGAGGQSSSCGSGGGQSHAWCSDFVGWVWARNGVAHLGDLDDRAASVYEYGKRYGTLHSTPQVGDAVVYNYSASAAYADHVALVTAVGGGSVTIVGGNEGHSSGHTEGIVQRESTTSYAVGDAPWGQTISGYISPAGVSTPTTVDITGDGKADLMVLSTDGTIGRRVGTGTSFGGGTDVSAGWQNFLGQAGQGRIYFADINGDGKKDLLVQGADGNVGGHLNNGDGTSFGGNVALSAGWQNFLGQAGQGRLYFADVNG
ncbi:FG-GAP-like repeat-containing protein, partial [Kitasatospora sp. NPDC088346]|uniref:FG-GAP-like repeat-containing protein n=1 Tax=Kitasatospora sp. NPDC088346 TaxID=3364073 RepID=UPI0038023DD5